MAQHLDTDVGARYAIHCRGDFEYDALPQSAETSRDDDGEGIDDKTVTVDKPPFRLREIDLTVPKGMSVSSKFPHVLM